MSSNTAAHSIQFKKCTYKAQKRLKHTKSRSPCNLDVTIESFRFLGSLIDGFDRFEFIEMHSDLTLSIFSTFIFLLYL